MTENFIVVPETSYLYDPCVRYVILCHNHILSKAMSTRKTNYDPEKAGWEQEYRYEPDVEGLVTVMNKTNGKDIHQVTNDNSFCSAIGFCPWTLVF